MRELNLRGALTHSIEGARTYLILPEREELMAGGRWEREGGREALVREAA